MSGFQMPKATDFKAAQLSGGEEGLGKPDDKEKNAAAESYNPPKAEEASLAGAIKFVEENKGKIGKNIENKLNKEDK